MHLVSRIGWLRAATLGANDGIVSVGSLIVGVAASNPGPRAILIAGIAAWAAGAMSMAAGEYVSVSTQADSEAADIAKERAELIANPKEELRELASIYVERGIEPDLAHQVAVQLSERDALAAHARDELGLSEHITARPLQAAFASSATFTVGAVVPMIVGAATPARWIAPAVTIACLLLLAVLGAAGARAGGAPMTKGVTRVTFWGALAFAVTAGIGHLVGTVI